MIDRRSPVPGSEVVRVPVRACRHPETRRFDDPVVREMLRALGVVTCDRCHEALRIHGRRFVREIPRRA
jgi:hypothetical protein